MKKIFLALFLLLIFLTFGSQLALAQENERVNVYFFGARVVRTAPMRNHF